MIWAILALLGVPLWLCAIALGSIAFRNRKLRKRPGNVPVRVLVPGKTRWSAGHGLWVSDVFAWRGSPAAWREDLVQVRGASARVPDAEMEKRLHRIGDQPVVATFVLADGGTLEVAGGVARQRHDLLRGARLARARDHIAPEDPGGRAARPVRRPEQPVANRGQRARVDAGTADARAAFLAADAEARATRQEAIALTGEVTGASATAGSVAGSSAARRVRLCGARCAGLRSGMTPARERRVPWGSSNPGCSWPAGP